MTETSLDPKALLVWRLRLSLWALVPAFLISFLFSFVSLPWTICTVALVVGYLFFFLCYYPIKFKKLTYFISDLVLVIRCGVFYTRVKSISLENIQYISVTQTPLQGLLGVRSVYVFAAGGSVYLPGVSAATAHRLQILLVPESYEVPKHE